MNTVRQQASAALPLAISMGDPAGIGPEILAAAWQARDHEQLPAFFMIGDPAALTAHLLSIPTVIIDTPGEAASAFAKALPILALTLPEPVRPGHLDPGNGPTVIDAIDRGVDLARAGAVAGLVTNPIHKAALYQAGFDAPGHTEHLARRCDLGDDDVVMMLAVEGLRVVPVTVHMALSRVPAALTKALIVHKAKITLRALQDHFGISQPRLAVAGLNPHAGENATIGTEERDIIAPAIEQLRADGHQVTGPLPADSLFHARARAAHDAVLCMYHDQALIPLKTIDFDRGVNVTLGLPIIRTSPDHGTALDIAGKGVARPDSLIAAIRMAGQMAATASETAQPESRHAQ